MALRDTPKRGYSGKSASILPAVIAGFSLLVCIILVIPVRNSQSASLATLGYVLGPIVVGICAALDRFLQQNGSIDPTFIEKPSYTRIIQIALILSFVFAMFHIWVLADSIGETLGEFLHG